MVFATTEKENPFFFIVGAGISSGSVPVASEIITRCKNKLNVKDGEINVLRGDSAEEYSQWLQQAFPHSISRQNFFRNLIENKQITTANFKLAHLLSAGNLANIVVTPNFDDFLSRALTLFNIKHIVCDHPGTSFKINVERSDIQIVHVHGTYLSYDCCNLTSEINERNQISNITNRTMASLFDRIADTRSPIIIGYSGWENDVVMTSLKKRLEMRLPYNLYWFCYSHDAYKNLPDWLVHHNDVVFVVPSERRNEDASFTEQLQKNKVLDANIVLDKIISGLDLPEPEITSDPINFFIKFIGGNDSVSNDSVSNDAFFLNHVVEKLKKLRENEGKDPDETEDYNFFQTTRQFVRRSQYDKALKLLDSININNLDERHRTELLQVLATIIFNVDTEDDEKKQEALYAHELFEETIKCIKSEKIEEIKKHAAPMYMLKAQLYQDLGELEKGLEIINEVLERIDFSADDSRNVKKYWHAYSLKGELLLDLGKPLESIASYSELISILEKMDILEDEQIMWSSLLTIGMIYEEELQDFPNAEKLYTKLLDLDEKLDEKTYAISLFKKIGVNLQREDFLNALSLLEQFESKFIDTRETLIKRLLVSSLDNKLKLVIANDVSGPEVIDTCNKIITVCADIEEKEDFDEIVCNAQIKKAFMLYDKHDYTGAASCFIDAFELGSDIAGINLVYMIRRGEFDYTVGKYTVEELLKRGLENEDVFAIINQALYLVQNKWDLDYWLRADTLIREMSELASDEIERALDWWINLAGLNDVEGDLVIGWLLRHQLIEDPKGLTLRERLDKAKINWFVQDFMYNKEESMLKTLK
ncbi:hypothetical protein CQ058_08095 [Bacillus sp. MYb56]|nr:hypothetical protein CQ058_08095 [Bacillus sp. MYb56]